MNLHEAVIFLKERNLEARIIQGEILGGTSIVEVDIDVPYTDKPLLQISDQFNIVNHKGIWVANDANVQAVLVIRASKELEKVVNAVVVWFDVKMKWGDLSATLIQIIVHLQQNGFTTRVKSDGKIYIACPDIKNDLSIFQKQISSAVNPITFNYILRRLENIWEIEVFKTNKENTLIRFDKVEEVIEWLKSASSDNSK